MASQNSRNSNHSERINVNDPYELKMWSMKFGVTPERVKEVVLKIGPVAEEVKAEIAKR